MEGATVSCDLPLFPVGPPSAPSSGNITKRLTDCPQSDILQGCLFRHVLTVEMSCHYQTARTAIPCHLHVSSVDPGMINSLIIRQLNPHLDSRVHFLCVTVLQCQSISSTSEIILRVHSVQTPQFSTSEPITALPANSSEIGVWAPLSHEFRQIIAPSKPSSGLAASSILGLEIWSRSTNRSGSRFPAIYPQALQYDESQLSVWCTDGLL